LRCRVFHTPSYSSALGAPPRSPLFPYTTLFRSMRTRVAERIASRRVSGMLAFGRFSGTLPFGLSSGDCVPLTRRQREILDFIAGDRKSTRLNSSHLGISYAVFCLKKKTPLSTT